METMVVPRHCVTPTKDVRSSSEQNTFCANLLECLCRPSVKQTSLHTSEKYIPDLKVLAENTVNLHQIPKELPQQTTTEPPKKHTSSVLTDGVVSKSYNNFSPTFCVNKIIRDESDIGEKLPRKKTGDFHKIVQMDMKVEKNRLETFKDVWPISYIDPADLAAAGFFYLQSGDKVQCAFCRGIIVDWAPGDDPLTEHSLHFPLCPFLMRRDVGNVPISGKSSVLCQDSKSYPEKFGPLKQSNTVCAEESSALCPKFSKMAILERRLCTFDSWQCHTVKPEELAEAGFFYTGTSDIVACFVCGGTLGHWDLGDDPWLEHKKHFPHCAYLKSANHSTVKTLSNGYQECISKPVCESQSLTDVSELMKSTVCAEASKIFDEKVVREALERQLEKKGKGFQNLEELCSTILEIQDEAQRKPSVGVESRVQNGRASAATSDRHVCKICYDKEMGVVFLPCGHMMACPECALSITTCPLCRKSIENSVRAYIS